MASAPAVASWRLVRLGLVIVLAALAGVVAILLVGATPGSATPHAGELVVNLPVSVWGLLFLGPLLAGLGAFVFLRLADSDIVRPRRLMIQAAVLMAVALVFLGLVYLSLPAGPGQVGVAVSHSSSPSGSANNSSGSHGNSTAAGTTPGTSFWTLSLPSWWLVAVAAGLAVVVGVFALPGVLGSLLDRRVRMGPGSVRERVQEALAQADLELQRGDDPRESIIKLYLRLVVELGPRVGETASLTADEIHSRIVSTLGVRPPASEALTRLFEVARYSTHTLGPDAVRRCQESIRLVRGDLDRGVPAR